MPRKMVMSWELEDYWVLMEAPDAVNAAIERFLMHPETQAAIGSTPAKL